MIPTEAVMRSIPGIPEQARRRPMQLGPVQSRLQAVRLLGSRAMGSHLQKPEIDLCLDGPPPDHADRPRPLTAVNALLHDLFLPWRGDRGWRRELQAHLGARVERLGRCLGRKP